MLRGGSLSGVHPAMLQSYNEGGYTDHLSYGQGHYHHQQWYNSYIHEGDNGGSDYSARSDGKETPDWRGYRDIPDTAYIPPQPSQDGGYPSQDAGGLMSGMQMDSPLMGQVLQDPGLMLPPQEHPQHASPLMASGVERLQAPQAQPTKEEEESLPKLDGSQSTPPGSGGKKDTLKLPGFHQTFGNITEIGRFSQPDEFFESRPPEIPDPPPKVSESLEVKRKPRGRKRKQPEPRELYPRSEPGGGPCSMGEPQWPPQPPHHWEPPPQPPHHHWHRPHPYYPPSHQYHHPGAMHHQYQQPPYYHHQHPHLDCPPPPPPYHYYQPNPWHPAAREYVHHHPYQGYV